MTRFYFSARSFRNAVNRSIAWWKKIPRAGKFELNGHSEIVDYERTPSFRDRWKHRFGEKIFIFLINLKELIYRSKNRFIKICWSTGLNSEWIIFVNNRFDANNAKILTTFLASSRRALSALGPAQLKLWVTLQREQHPRIFPTTPARQA